jgi:hypothetical protein
MTPAKAKLKAVAALILVFVAGIAFGVIATRAIVWHRVRQVLAEPDQVRRIVERRMIAQLRLDAEQRRQVDRILSRTQGELKDLRIEFAPRFHEIMSNTAAEISVVLRPDQREKFRHFVQENRNLVRP